MGIGSASVASFPPQADTLTYEPYFGLNEKPFSLSADPRFVYDSPTHGATRESLLAGIRRREGLQVLTGEIGTGKTTLCRAVLRDLGRKTYSSIVPDPFASREDLLKMLLIDFGVLTIQELTDGRLRQASRTELGYLLSEFLHSLTPDTFVVVMMDEAQNMSLPLIEETRILADTFGAQGRLQIVFVGQPELHAKLKLPEMRQVDQRVCGYHRLGPLSREAVAGYLQHRLQVAGGDHDRVLFPQDVVDSLHARSGGVPRLINRVCDRALQLACEQQAEAVDRTILDTALMEVGATTLSPTWDSIIFADAPAPPPAVTPAPPPVDIAAPAPMAPPPADPFGIAPMDDEELFKKQIEHWVDKDLAPPKRNLRPMPAVFADEMPQAQAPAPAPAPAPKRVPRIAPKLEVPARSVRTDWPRDLRSETYMQRLWRKWMKRAAIILAVFAGLNAIAIAASLLSGAVSAPVLPTLPKAPVFVAPGLDAPQAPVAGAPVAVAAAPAAVSVSGEYLVTVGMFANRDRADQLVDTLAQAGLPAMQRLVQLRRQQVQQIVLGPFLSHPDAVEGLRRLQQLGGYDDATIVDFRAEPAAH